MRERLIELMNLLKCTPTQFANSIGVQRATLQHILTGRNEPSLKIVMAVHNSFPQIDLEWLLNGVGNPFGDSQIPQSSANDYPLFPGMENVIIPASSQDFDEFQNVKEEPKQVQTRKRLNNKDVKRESDTQMESTVKRVKEVVVFFEDGTYQKFS